MTDDLENEVERLEEELKARSSSATRPTRRT